jgi:hypothetical protein
MATLFNQQIDLTYEGLLKTTDNAVIGAVEKQITDGLGNSSTLKLGTTSASFTGTLDLTGATVTGIPTADTTYDLAATANGANVDITLTGSDATVDTVVLVAGTNVTLSEAAGAVTIDVAGGAGLESGTGTDSMQSAASLTTTAANASALNSIALGNGADATQTKNIAIGTGNAGSTTMIVIGDATAASQANSTIAIGNNYPTDLAFRGDSVSVGHGIYPSQFGVYLGNGANHTAGGSTRCVAVGHNSKTSANQTISLGADTITTAADSVAVGYGITAALVGTVSLKEIEMQTPGGGIIFTSPNGTRWKETISNTGVRVITQIP